MVGGLRSQLRDPRHAIDEAWRRLRARVRCRAQVVSTEVKDLIVNPRAERIPTYWFHDPDNFGDELTPWLLPRYGIVPHWTKPQKARLAGVGSVLHEFPEDFAGAVWGSGLIRDIFRPMPRATFLAVRGALTAARVGAPASTPLGDPGLLLARNIPRASTVWDLGLVLHKIHRGYGEFMRFANRYPRNVLVIDVGLGPEEVTRQIGSCAGILTSSLHGLIVADSFGIPAAWMTLQPTPIGGVFKFLDHESVVLGTGNSRRLEVRGDDRLAIVASQLVRADPVAVARAVSGLERSISLLRFGRFRALSEP